MTEMGAERTSSRLGPMTAIPPIVDISAKEINSQISLAVFITNQWIFLGLIEYYPY